MLGLISFICLLVVAVFLFKNHWPNSRLESIRPLTNFYFTTARLALIILVTVPIIFIVVAALLYWVVQQDSSAIIWNS